MKIMIASLNGQKTTIDVAPQSLVVVEGGDRLLFNNDNQHLYLSNGNGGFFGYAWSGHHGGGPFSEIPNDATQFTINDNGLYTLTRRE